MHRMGLMTMLLEDSSLNMSKMALMAIIHDIAEAIVVSFDFFFLFQ